MDLGDTRQLEVGVNRRIVDIRDRCVHVIDAFDSTSPLRMRKPFNHFGFFVVVDEDDHRRPEDARFTTHRCCERGR